MADERLTYPRCPICNSQYRYAIAKPRLSPDLVVVEWTVPLIVALCRPTEDAARTITVVKCPNKHPFNRTRSFYFHSILEFHGWYYATTSPSPEAFIDPLQEKQGPIPESSQTDVYAGVALDADQHGPYQQERAVPQVPTPRQSD